MSSPGGQKRQDVDWRCLSRAIAPEHVESRGRRIRNGAPNDQSGKASNVGGIVEDVLSSDPFRGQPRQDEAIGKDLKVQHVVGNGTIYNEIYRYANETNCDLIVMASHRPELADYLLGPNAARVVRHATQSVMVVRD